MKIQHCKVTKVNTEDKYNYFFGYYDKCPWNKDETKVLCHRADFLERFPNPDDQCELGVIDLLTQEFTPFDTTSAWNWQQGAQLQWIDWNGHECAIYNVKENKDVHARIHDFDTGDNIDMPHSVYSVSCDGKYAATLNYARLYDCRKDYGIAGLKDPYFDDNSPQEDGIFVWELATGKQRMLVSTRQLEATASNAGQIRQYKQRENHIMFSPSGRRFCFMHRYFTTGNIQQSRLFTLDVEGKDLRLLFEGFVSHYDWKDEETIVAWAGKRKLISGGDKKFNPMKLIKKCLKPIYYALGKPRILMQKVLGDSYYLIKDEADIEQNVRLGMGQLYCDGHCTVSPDRKWLLTDGYTDSKNRLPLFLFNIETSELYEIGRYATPKHLDGELRIDLHPRFNHDGTKVFIDSGMSGKRDMYIVDVKDIVDK